LDEQESEKGLSMELILSRATAPSAFQCQTNETFIPLFKYPIKLADYEENLQNLDYSKLMRMKNVSGELGRLLNHKEELPGIEDILYDPIYESYIKNSKEKIMPSSFDEIYPVGSDEPVSDEMKSPLSTKTSQDTPINQIEDDDKSEASQLSTSDLEDWLDSVL
jgi:hypothetical protein